MKSRRLAHISTFFFAALILFFPKIALSQLSQSQLSLTLDQQTQIQDLAARLLKHADAAGCKKTCSILVANFTGETGQTSPLAVQLADEVSQELAAQAKGLQIVGRHYLQQYLERERIPSKLLEDDNAARWLAMENGATVVLIGYLKVGLTEATLRAQLLDTKDFASRNAAGKSRIEEAVFRNIANLGDVEPAEPFGEARELDPSKQTYDSSKIRRNDPLTSAPSCSFHPDPSYTDAARRVKFQGSLVLRVIISKEGNIPSLQVLKGLPFGLNKQALETVSKWRCQPAKINGQPADTMVPIEISFRLY